MSSPTLLVFCLYIAAVHAFYNRQFPETTPTEQVNTPNRGRADFDCPMRQMAMQFAQTYQPWLTSTQLTEIADALHGSGSASCNLTQHIDLHRGADQKSMTFNEDEIGTDIVIFVDAIHGNDDTHDGSKTRPFRTLHKAVQVSRKYNALNRHEYTQKAIFLREGRYYLRETLFLNASDSNLFISSYNNEQAEISGALPLFCEWKQSSFNSNVFQCDINANAQNANISDALFTGLRVNGSRGIRARYPNNNPETNGFGSSLRALSWVPPTLPKSPGFVVTPDYPFNNGSYGGFFQHFTLGLGGPCNNFLPTAGYWCSTDALGDTMYTVPSGLVYNQTILPHTPYANTSYGVVQAWRPAHWSSWMFEMDEADNLPEKNTLLFSKGGFQGARGNSQGDEFFVENIFEELDYPTEWFYNRTTRTLYYYNNNTDGQTDINDLVFEVTQLKVLFNYTGSMDEPIENVSINGLVFRDTGITYLEPHSMPSGGDWALQRTAALYIEGTKNLSISNNLFTRLDGNAIGLNKYNRNVTIYRNEIVWNGDNVIYTWGDTEGVSFPDENTTTSMGWDGTNGNQPRFINISYNLVHELGIFEKQSSFYFQAKSCQNYIGYNILYNGPRAGINLNDGFGGGSTITKNLIFNFVRESGDHGPINSWDRQVYVTKVRNGTASTQKALDVIYKNFIIAVYNSQEAVDNDDGSCYYNTSYNFLVYGDYGMKSDFGGHDNYYHNNILAYLNNNCFGINGFYPANIDRFYNNTCIMNHAGPSVGYGQFNCSSPMNEWPYLAANLVQCENCNATSTGLCGLNEVEFQEKYNFDLGTKVTDWPNNTLLLLQAQNMIFS